MPEEIQPLATPPFSSSNEEGPPPAGGQRSRPQPGRAVSATLWMFGAGVFSNLALGASGVITARLLGPGGRGVIVLFITVSSLVSLFGSLGTPMGARIHLVSSESHIGLPEYWGLVLAQVIGGFVLGTLVAMLALPFVGVSTPLSVALVVGGYSSYLMCSLFAINLLHTFGLNSRAALLEVIASVALLGAVAAVLVLHVSLSPIDFLLIYLGAGSIHLVFAVVVLHASGLLGRPAVDLQAWRTIIRTGFPAIGISLSESLTFRFDRYLIGLFLSPAAVGLYSVAVTSTELLRISVHAISQVLFHRLAAGVWGRRRFEQVRLLSLGLTIASGAALFLIAPLLVRKLFGEDFSGAVAPLRILILAEIAAAYFFVTHTALSATISPRKSALAAFTGLVVVVAGDFILIPSAGIRGAALASVIGYVSMAIAAQRLLSRGQGARAKGWV